MGIQNELIAALYPSWPTSWMKEQVSVVLRYIDTDYVIQARLVNIECTDSTDADFLVQLH